MQNLLLPLENYFMAFFFFFFATGNTLSYILCYFAFITYSEVFKKYLNAFQKWILAGTKLLEPRVQLLKIHCKNLNLGPWRSAAKETTYLSLLLHMRHTTLK